jgi:hypothetical protein
MKSSLSTRLRTKQTVWFALGSSFNDHALVDWYVDEIEVGARAVHLKDLIQQ